MKNSYRICRASFWERSPSSASGWLAYLFVAQVLLDVSTGQASDNRLGFPKPIDPDQPGIVMLHGGGISGDDKFREAVRRKFAELATPKGGEARLVLMPSDTCVRGKKEADVIIDGGESREAFEERLSGDDQYGRWKALEDDEDLNVASFKFAYHDPINDPHHEQICEAIRNATGVWIPAYDQEWLPDIFAKEYFDNVSPVVTELRQLLARGGVIGGLGGGMACLPETIIAGDLYQEEGYVGWTQPKLRFGLGLFDGAIVDKDFENADRLERLTHVLVYGQPFNRNKQVPGVKPTTIGVGVEHFAVAILRPNSIEAFADEGVNVFLRQNDGRTITWVKLPSGKTIDLSKSVDDPPNQKEHRNPFGLPTDENGEPRGTVVLHGGGRTDKMNDEFPRLSQIETPRLVLCPIASDDFRPVDEDHKKLLRPILVDYYYEWRNQVRFGALSGIDFLVTNTAKDADNPEFVEPLRQAGAVWFGGGSQWVLRDLLIGTEGETTLVEKEIKNVLRRGGVVGGTSAGLAIMPARVIVYDRINEGKTTVERGFGVLDNVLADQHFNAREGRLKRLTDRLWEEEKTDIGIAVDEKTALIINADGAKVHGDQLAHIFLKSRHQGFETLTWHLLRPDDEAIIQDSDEGFRLKLIASSP